MIFDGLMMFDSLMFRFSALKKKEVKITPCHVSHPKKELHLAHVIRNVAMSPSRH